MPHRPSRNPRPADETSPTTNTMAEASDGTRRDVMAERIIGAAQAVIGRRGAERMSMQDVGKAAQVSRATLYRHFSSKEALLAAIAERRLQDFTTQLAASIAATNDPGHLLNSLVHVLDRYYTLEKPVKYLEHEPEFTVATFRANFSHYLCSFVTLAGGKLGQISGYQELIPLPIIAELLIRLMLSDVLVPSAPQALFISRLRPYLEALMQTSARAPRETHSQTVERPAVASAREDVASLRVVKIKPPRGS